MCYEGVYFLRRNLNFWPYLVKLHEKKFGTIQKFLPLVWNPCLPLKTCCSKHFWRFFYKLNLIKHLTFCKKEVTIFHSNHCCSGQGVCFLIFYSNFTVIVVILRQSCQTLPKKSPNCLLNHRFSVIFKLINTIWLNEPSTSAMTIRCALDMIWLKNNNFLECFWFSA